MDKPHRSVLQQMTGVIAGISAGGFVAVASAFFLAAVLPNNKDLIAVAFLVAIGLGMFVGIIAMRNVAKQQAENNARRENP